MTYSKDDQLARSPGGNRICAHGNLRSICNERACINRRNRTDGLKAQRRDGKILARGLGAKPGLLNNEETTNWPIRWEEKSGKLALPVRKFYEVCKAQSDTATFAEGARHNLYPVVAIADGLAVLPVDDLRRLLNDARRGVARDD